MKSHLFKKNKINCSVQLFPLMALEPFQHLRVQLPPSWLFLGDWKKRHEIDLWAYRKLHDRKSGQIICNDQSDEDFHLLQSSTAGEGVAFSCSSWWTQVVRATTRLGFGTFHSTRRRDDVTKRGLVTLSGSVGFFGFVSPSGNNQFYFVKIVDAIKFSSEKFTLTTQS